MSSRFVLRVNGRSVGVNAAGETPLLYILRNDLGLNGPKFGCGLGQCGSCAVLIDGKSVFSCVIKVSDVIGRKIVTSEGLGSEGKPHPLQDAFISEQAAQCGYCISGMVVEGAALLKRTPSPTHSDIIEALDRHLCRCGTHLRIVRAIQNVAKKSAAL